MSLKRWIGRIGLVLGGLFLGLLAADVGARFLQPHGAADLLFNAPDNAPQGLYVSDPEVVYLPNPGFTGTMKSLGYKVPIRFNQHSLRGGEVPAKGDTPRWLAGGDSFTLALQVTEEETFSQRLGAAKGWEVWNAGADGYSTWNAARRYAQIDDELDLDGMVVMFFLGNDFEDNQRFNMDLDRAQQREAGAVMSNRRFSAPVTFLLRNSYIYGWWLVRERAAALQRPDSPERQRWAQELKPFTKDGGGALNARMRETRRALEELKRTMKERDDEVLVAIAPPAFVVDTARVQPTFELMGLDPARADLRAPGLVLEGVLKQIGLPACDLVQPLQEAAETASEPLYFTYDGHWTSAGHAVVADALDACLAG